MVQIACQSLLPDVSCHHAAYQVDASGNMALRTEAPVLVRAMIAAQSLAEAPSHSASQSKMV